MPLTIKPNGLLDGERLAKLSGEARLWWPHIFALSNSYGCFVIHYQTAFARVFGNFSPAPTERQFHSWLREYKKAHLLYVFRSGDEVWGAWDDVAPAKYHPKADEQDARPDQEEFNKWRSLYAAKKTGKPKHSKRTAAPSALSLVTDEENADHPQGDLFAASGEETESAIGQSFPKNDDFSETISKPFSKNGDFFQNTTLTQTHTLKNSNSEFTQTPQNSDSEALTQPETTEIFDAEVVGDDFKPPPDYKPDESWPLFRVAADSVGMIATADQWLTLETVTWQRYSFAHKLLAIRGIDLRREGEYRDPAYVHGAHKYLTERLWTAPPRPVPRQNAPIAIDRKTKAREEFRKRMAQEKGLPKGLLISDAKA